MAYATLQTSEDLLLCNECGTQYAVKADSGKDECKVCDDPRQYVPATGQVFTTLWKMRADGFKNVWWQDQRHPDVWSVRTEPQFAIGNRAELICTDQGNIMWDLIPFLDQETVDKINNFGGLKAIVISHPHYYSTWADWSRTFHCPIFAGAPDAQWFERRGTSGTDLRFLTETQTAILPGELAGFTAILAGGHFPGSLLMHWRDVLFIADTIFPAPSATEPVPGRPGKITFTFFWSIPNRIPLHPDEILSIWNKVKHLDFHACFGAFKGMDIYTMDNEKERKTGGVKGRLLESCKMYVSAMGWEKDQHAIFGEAL